MFLGIFRSDLQKFVKKGSKFDPPGPKNGHFLPFFGHFCSFLDFKTFLESGFFWFFNMMFLDIFRSEMQKIVEKGSKFGPPGPKNNLFWPFLQFFGLWCFSSELIFLIFNMLFLGIFRSDLNKILKKGSNFEGLKKRRDFSISQKLA